MEKAEIIVIGDELLIGQVTDTNSGMIARLLGSVGISVLRTTVVHDDAAQIRSAIDDAFARVNLVLTTGGLGPTKDDITKKTLCEYFHTKLIKSEEVERHVRELYQDRPQVLNRLTQTQWYVPAECTILENRVGSAPLMLFEKDGKTLFSMPGVPTEAEVAMKEQFIPLLKSRLSLMPSQSQIIHKTIIVYGIPESALAIKIEDWENALPQNMHLAYLPKNRMIRLRLTGTDDQGGNLESEMTKQIQQLKSIIKDFIVAEEDLPIEVLVGNRLRLKGQTVASAESCTGGKIAELLNKHSGSSIFYKGSVVAYANSVKETVLGVKKDSLQSVGAVSEEVVWQMAEGVRNLIKTDYAVATSGIAGPDGGTKEKPVGTVWIAVATPDKTVAECFHFVGNRNSITDQAAIMALVMLLKEL